jgi:AcrR family transcriptional regulator
MVVMKAEIRDQIIESASDIFSRYGFKKTTMDEIAMAMHKGKSSIYYYFKSKEEIFESVVEKEALSMRKELKEATNASNNPKDKLRSYISTRMKAFKRLSNFYEAIKSEYLSHHSFINHIRIKYDENEISNISEILTSGVEQGMFKVDNTQLAAIAIVTAMKGLEIPLFWSTNEHDLEKRIDNLLSILFYGIVER